MSSALQADVVVLGAGVVGLAVAARLASSGLAVVLLEQHEGFGRETSSRSSERADPRPNQSLGSLAAR